MPKRQTYSTSSQPPSSYIGRFAPSPSGPLHNGSLIAALASYLDAKANDGLWLVRMEDLDPPRESPEAAKSILQTLESLHLFWDGEVLYQSQRHQAYAAVLESLRSKNLSFPCTCTRQQIQSTGGVHLGICELEKNIPCAIRCCCSEEIIQFTDLIQGKQIQNKEQAVGDFVIKRKDNLYAYQLAVVVDDAFQNITHVIRGIDLLESTSRQIMLQKYLGFMVPQYGHIPVIVNEHEQKLSKQHFAQAVQMENPQLLLINALTYLQQEPEPQLSQASLEDILKWGINHWQPKKLAGLKNIREFED